MRAEAALSVFVLHALLQLLVLLLQHGNSGFLYFDVFLDFLLARVLLRDVHELLVLRELLQLLRLVERRLLVHDPVGDFLVLAQNLSELHFPLNLHFLLQLGVNFILHLPLRIGCRLLSGGDGNQPVENSLVVLLNVLLSLRELIVEGLVLCVFDLVGHEIGFLVFGRAVYCDQLLQVLLVVLFPDVDVVDLL